MADLVWMVPWDTLAEMDPREKMAIPDLQVLLDPQGLMAFQDNEENEVSKGRRVKLARKVCSYFYAPIELVLSTK